MPSERKIALITGGSRGIGLGIARALAAEGCDLAINGVRDEGEVADVLDELRGLGAEVIYCQGNIGDAAARAGIIDKVRSHFGRLNVLVNNAGVGPKTRNDITELSEEDYDRVLGVNLKGAFFLTQATARWMLEQKAADAAFSGCIINVASVSSIAASINRGHYCIAKAGLAMSTKLWAVRLAAEGIGVYELQPGIITTDMTAGVKEKYELLEPRWGRPADIGKAAAMLVRGDLPYAPGQVLRLDGGMLVERL